MKISSNKTPRDVATIVGLHGSNAAVAFKERVGMLPQFILTYNKITEINRKDLFPALVPAFTCKEDLLALVAHVRIVSPRNRMASDLENESISKWEKLTSQAVL